MEFDSELLFQRLVEVGESELDLARAALEIARDEYPTLEPEATLGALDSLARRALEVADGDERPVEQLKALNTCLFDELGLSGNQDAYYDPRNSYLNDVLDRKLGIPISLSVIYLDVGWRMKLPLMGVSFPGHFLVKCHIGEALVVVDPFHGGRSLDEAALLARLREVTGSRDDLSRHLPRFLGGVSKQEILARMLRNLKSIFVREERFERALRVCNKLCLLGPQAPLERRDRGIVYENLDCFALAAADFQAYLDEYAHAPDAPAVKRRLEELRRKAARLN